MPRIRRSDFTHQEWRERVRKQAKEAKRRYKLRHPERVRERARSYYYRVYKAKRIELNRRWRSIKKNRDRQRRYWRLRSREGVLSADLHYIKNLISRHNGIRYRDISDEFALLWRKNLLLKRTIKGALNEQSYTHRRRPAETAG